MINVGIDNVHIDDSYLVRKRKDMNATIIALRGGTSSLVWKRSNKSLVREWCGHNLLFDCHLFRSHTQSVDLQYPSAWYLEIAWFVLSCFYWE